MSSRLFYIAKNNRKILIILIIQLLLEYFIDILQKQLLIRQIYLNRLITNIVNRFKDNSTYFSF